MWSDGVGCYDSGPKERPVQIQQKKLYTKNENDTRTPDVPDEQQSPTNIQLPPIELQLTCHWRSIVHQLTGSWPYHKPGVHLALLYDSLDAFRSKEIPFPRLHPCTTMNLSNMITTTAIHTTSCHISGLLSVSSTHLIHPIEGFRLWRQYAC